MNNVEIKKYKVRIFGEIYVIVSDEQEQFIAEMVTAVDELMKEISQKSHGGLDAKKIAVLAALKATQEKLSLQKKLQQGQDQAEKIITLLGKEEIFLL